MIPVSLADVIALNRVVGQLNQQADQDVAVRKALAAEDPAEDPAETVPAGGVLDSLHDARSRLEAVQNEAQALGMGEVQELLDDALAAVEAAVVAALSPAAERPLSADVAIRAQQVVSAGGEVAAEVMGI